MRRRRVIARVRALLSPDVASGTGMGEKNPDFDIWSAGPDGEADREILEAAVNQDNIE